MPLQCITQVGGDLLVTNHWNGGLQWKWLLRWGMLAFHAAERPLGLCVWPRSVTAEAGGSPPRPASLRVKLKIVIIFLR